MTSLDRYVLREDREKWQKWSEKENNKNPLKTTREVEDIKSERKSKQVRSHMVDHVREQRRLSVKSEMVNWRWRFLFLFILESSSNLATALAVSISPIVNIFYWEVALSWFRWEVERHFMEQKLQPRSVFKL